MVNYKCHRSLKEKQTSSLEETRLLRGPHVDYTVVGIFMVRADARLVDAPALEIVRAPVWETQEMGLTDGWLHSGMRPRY